MRTSGLVVLVLGACGGSSTSEETPDGAPSDGAPSDGPGTDPNKTGRVSIIEVVGGQTTSEGATFLDVSNTPGINERTEGPCVIRSANTPDLGLSVSAGDITITHEADVITLGYGIAQSAYVSQTQQGRHYAPGDSLSIEAAGSTVPGFMGTVTFPSPITVTSPTAGAGLFNLDTSVAFSAAWTGNNGAPVLISIDQFPISQNVPQLSVKVRCGFTGTSASIPSSVFNNFVTNQAQDFRISISISALAVTSVAAGDFGVEIAAFNGAFSVMGFASEPL